MKRKYEVQVPVNTVITYIMEAESEEEAKEIVASGTLEPTQNSMQSPHYEDLDSNNWTITCITDQLEDSLSLNFWKETLKRPYFCNGEFIGNFIYNESLEVIQVYRVFSTIANVEYVISFNEEEVW